MKRKELAIKLVELFHQDMGGKWDSIMYKQKEDVINLLGELNKTHMDNKVVKTVIIPTDFSDVSEKAALYAMNLFKDDPGVQYILFHGAHIPLGSSESFTTSLKDAMIREAYNDLIRQRESLLQHMPNANIDMVTELGPLEPTLSTYINRTDVTADLIVIGTSGANTFFGKAIGTNTSSLIQKVGCPIIVVPEQSEQTKIERVLFTTDSNWTTLNPSSLAHIVSSIDVEVVPFKTNDKNVAEAITNESEGFDMIVMVAHKHNGIEGLFHHSITKDVVMETKLPLLILND